MNQREQMTVSSQDSPSSGQTTQNSRGSQGVKKPENSIADVLGYRTSKAVRSCQICGSGNLKSEFFVGFIPPVNLMPEVGTVAEEAPAYPLEMIRCPECTLVQIGCEVDQRVLFPHEYPYLSGSTRILRENFADLQREASQVLGLEKNSLVVDIGSNDGTLLSSWVAAGYPVMGVEPSQAADIANSRGIRTKKAYFNAQTAADVRREHGGAKVVTAANVFAHIGDIHSIVDAIVGLLDEKGVFVSESHYLLDLIETIQYDTIYHEHLRYYSLRSLKFLLEKHGLEVFRVRRIPTHGGSIRVYAARKGQYAVDASVKHTLDLETQKGLDDGSGLKAFKERVLMSKLELLALLKDVKKTGARIFGVGAPSRASTLVNYLGLDDGILDCTVEIKGSNKLNKYMPGTRIPVLEESKLFNEQPEYALFLSWHIANELAANLRKNGYRGKFITPLPKPAILEI